MIKSFTLGMMLTVSLAQAAPTIKWGVSGNSYTVSVCESGKAGKNFSLKDENKNKLVEDGLKIQNDNCLTTTLTNGKACQAVNIFIDGQATASTIYEQQCGSGATTTPAAPAKPRADSDDFDKIKKTADNRARQFANLEVKKQDIAYQRQLYNFIYGFSDSLKKNQDNADVINKYTLGSSEGETKGSTEGYPRGVNEGESQALQNATNSVIAQYKGALDTDASNFKASENASTPSFSGLNNSYNLPTSYPSVIRTEDFKRIIQSNFNEVARRQDLGQRGLEAIINGDLNLNGLYPEELGESTQWNNFINSKESDYYSDLSRFENSDDAKAAFRSTFKNVYSSVIEEKLDREVTKRDDRAFNAGADTAITALKQTQFNKGYVDGYENSYRQSSIVGFNKSYSPKYTQTFKAKVSQLDNSVNVISFKASIIDENGKQDFVIGRPVFLKIEEITNIGRISSPNESLKIEGAVSSQTSINIKGLSRNSGIAQIPAGTLSSRAQLGTQYVTITVAGFTTKAGIEIKWENQVKALSTLAETEVESINLLSQFVTKTIIGEWIPIHKDPSYSQETNPYKLTYLTNGDFDKMKNQPKVVKIPMAYGFSSEVKKMKKKTTAVLNVCSNITSLFDSIYDYQTGLDWAPKEPTQLAAWIKNYTDATARVQGDQYLNTLANYICSNTVTKDGSTQPPPCIKNLDTKNKGSVNSVRSMVSKFCK